jgi:hypothetical protein
VTPDQKTAEGAAVKEFNLSEEQWRRLAGLKAG